VKESIVDLSVNLFIMNYLGYFETISTPEKGNRKESFFSCLAEHSWYFVDNPDKIKVFPFARFTLNTI
jgi:hypothetical protein